MGGSIVASCIILLIHLLLLMLADAKEGFSVIDEKMSKEVELNEHMEARLKADPIIKMKTQMDEVDQQEQQKAAHSSSSSHMNHINTKTKVFFTMNELKQGQKLLLNFREKDPSKIPPFLSKEEADPIPFSLKEVPEILSYFSFSSNSPQAQAITQTLQSCEIPPMEGETKFCATSKESMVDFVRTSLGSQFHYFKPLTSTTHRTIKSNARFQNYTIIEAPTKTTVPRVVVCHNMIYTYAVYYCHYRQGYTNVLKIPLRAENGDLLHALAICHMHTSQRSPVNPAVQALNIDPGTIPVCHFLHADDLVWMSLPAS